MANIGDYARACGGNLHAGILLRRFMQLNRRPGCWSTYTPDRLICDTQVDGHDYNEAMLLLEESCHFIETMHSSEILAFAFRVTNAARAAVSKIK